MSFKIPSSFHILWDYIYYDFTFRVGGGSASDSKALSLQPARTLVLRIVLLRFWIKSSYHGLSLHCCYWALWSRGPCCLAGLHCLALVQSLDFTAFGRCRPVQGHDAYFLSVVCFSRCNHSFWLCPVIFLLLFPKSVLAGLWMGWLWQSGWLEGILTTHTTEITYVFP